MSNQDIFDKILKSGSKAISVIAGPGSGKTTGVLIPKAQQILSMDHIDPEKILILSFSRLSADDLRNKIKSKFSGKTPKASTLHSYCLGFLLNEDSHGIKKRIDSILLDFEKDILISDLVEDMPNANVRNIKKLLNEFSAAWAVAPHDIVFNEPEEKKQFKQLVVNWLDEHEAAMMEEIVYFAVDIAKKVKSNLIDDPQYIFVDEYQDLNKLEQEFVDILAKDSQLLLAVGDPDQSIYSFKFAHPEGIKTFSDRNDVEKYTLKYTGRCAKKIVEKANLVLRQIDPTRKHILNPLPNAEEGEVVINQLEFQDDEFESTLNSVEFDLNSGTLPKNIIILVPKKKLGNLFVRFANENKKLNDIEFNLSNKIDLSLVEQERILLFGLIVNPTSKLRIRTLIGLHSTKNHAAREIKTLKEKYGSYEEILSKSNSDDFDKNEKKVKQVIEQVIQIRELLNKFREKEEVTTRDLIDQLFPAEVEELQNLRATLGYLYSESDTIKSLYDKFIDYMRTIKSDNNVIRVMTILGSKGLDAENVYIIGCNDGNIPGKNRSEILDDHEYKQEQKRLFYVGVTRAKKKLVISWSRYIPFEQARGHHTSTTGTIRKNGKVYSRVGLSEFVQELI